VVRRRAQTRLFRHGPAEAVGNALGQEFPLHVAPLNLRSSMHRNGRFAAWMSAVIALRPPAARASGYYLAVGLPIVTQETYAPVD
jgi:hypothetical protein